MEVHDAAQGVVSLILIFCVLRREAAFVTSWSGRCSQGRQVSEEVGGGEGEGGHLDGRAPLSSPVRTQTKPGSILVCCSKGSSITT